LQDWIFTARARRSPAVRLVCVPYAGGGIDVFAGWADRLPACEVGIVQLPGRGSRLRDPLVDTVGRAAAAVAGAVAAMPAFPTVLFGHGLGALIAFETARRLRDRTWPLLGLFVSGQRAPALPPAQPSIAALPDAEFLAAFAARYEPAVRTTLGDPDLQLLLLPGMRADMAMAEQYLYEPSAPLDCPIAACGGSDDPYASREDMEAWSAATRARTSVHVFAGGHFYLLDERPAITRLIGNRLTVMLGALARSTERR
jgi:medium-chain acyl-[acyl-carrier-protein] hydrolase